MTNRRDHATGKWWDRSWNWTTGCAPMGVSCGHCWAEAMVKRFPHLHGFDSGDIYGNDADPLPFHFVQVHPDRIHEPLKWKKGQVIASSFLGDIFNEYVNTTDIMRALAVVAITPHHRYYWLTKRTRRMAEFFNTLNIETLDAYIKALAYDANITVPLGPPEYRMPNNLAIGMSAGTQGEYKDRLTWFMSTRPPFQVRRFLHFEPLLDYIEIRNLLGAMSAVEWIVVGGENGPGARHTPAGDFLALHKAASTLGIPFYFKGPGTALRKAERFEWNDAPRTVMPRFEPEATRPW